MGLIAALATLVTLFLATPVLRAPSERMFGLEMVGRHHDPFTVMAGFEHPAVRGPLTQPVTDWPGTLLARIVGPVPAYNIIVLASFPLSAVAAYLLATSLGLGRIAAGSAALAFAFSPFHISHAAYHPHVAQTQWIPLYFLALWRCLEAPTRLRACALAAAAGAALFSNFYGGLVVAVLTPVAAAAHILAARTCRGHALRRAAITSAPLAIVAGLGLLWAWRIGRGAPSDSGALSFPAEDLVRYGATAWSYFIPPVAHPVFGAWARHWHTLEGPVEGLVERQLALGMAPAVFACVAGAGWLATHRRDSSLRAAPVLAVMALVAIWCSLTPPLGPSGVLHALLPCFRAYARFGVVVQLMTVLLAGLGAQWLWRTSRRRGRAAVAAFAILTIAEYAVVPSGLWRDTLPTQGHRWVLRQPATVRAADCVAPTPESASIDWLTRGRVAATGGVLEDCTADGLSSSLAGLTFTHLIVRRDSEAGRWFGVHPPAAGLALAATFPDSNVYAVTAAAPSVFTAEMQGFYPVEHGPAGAFRWMGAQANWVVVNASPGPLTATLAMVLESVEGRRGLDLDLDGRRVRVLQVEGPRDVYEVRGLHLAPGPHRLTFRAQTPAVVADKLLANGDGRALSFAFGSWRWSVMP